MRTPAFLRPLTGLVRTAALLGAVALTAVGCDTPEGTSAPPPASECPAPESRALALVVGARSNSPVPQLPSYVKSLLDAAVDESALVAVVRVDGSPETVFAKPFHSDAQNDPARDADRNSYLKQVAAAMRSAKAVRPEADPLTAIGLAARATGPGGTVVVVDSGLQTVEPLDFRGDGVLDAEPDDVAGFLARSASLPSLSGIHVRLVGIGDTSAPQSPLPVRRRRQFGRHLAGDRRRGEGRLRLGGRDTSPGPVPRGHTGGLAGQRPPGGDVPSRLR